VNFLFDFWRPTDKGASRSDLFAAPSFSLGFNFRKSSLTRAPRHVKASVALAPVRVSGPVDSSSMMRMGAPSSYLAERLLRSVYSALQHRRAVCGLTSSGMSQKVLYEAIRAPSAVGARKSVYCGKVRNRFNALRRVFAPHEIGPPRAQFAIGDQESQYRIGPNSVGISNF